MKTAADKPFSMDFHGIPIVIQFPKGSMRTGRRKDGTPFKTLMKADYGYVKNTISAGDGESLDVYIGDDKASDKVYIIEQIRTETGKFDEYKVLLGFPDLESAVTLYTYQLGDNADVELGDISEVSLDYFLDKVEKEINKNDTKIKTQVASMLMLSLADPLYKPTKDSLTPEKMKLVDDLNTIVQVEDQRLAVQSKGLTTELLGAEEAAKKAIFSGKIKEAGYNSYFEAKLAIWQVHRADEIDDRLKGLWKDRGQDNPFVAAAREILGFAPDQDLTAEQASQLMQKAQQLKTNRST